ncbi:MAG: hypothetical protein K2X91_13915 [Thermoleophilia bacterium]|nr:hypothetical protein [Thermoleophilia bacterium]
MSAELDPEGLGRLVQNLVVDWIGGADLDHIKELFSEALAVSPHQAYMAIALTCSLTSRLFRGVLADELALAESLGTPAFFGLQVQPRPGVDMNAPELRGKHVVMQTITAQLNDDPQTAAALVMALVRSDEGPALCPFALKAALEVFAGIYATPAGKAAALELGIRDA